MWLDYLEGGKVVGETRRIKHISRYTMTFTTNWNMQRIKRPLLYRCSLHRHSDTQLTEL